MRIVRVSNAPGILGETIEILPDNGRVIRNRNGQYGYQNRFTSKGRKPKRPRVHLHNK